MSLKIKKKTCYGKAAIEIVNNLCYFGGINYESQTSNQIIQLQLKQNVRWFRRRENCGLIMKRNHIDSYWHGWRNLQLPPIIIHWLITLSANMIKCSINSLSYFFFTHRIKKKNSQISEQISWIHNSFYSISFMKHSIFIAINKLKCMPLPMSNDQCPMPMEKIIVQYAAPQ